MPLLVDFRGWQVSPGMAAALRAIESQYGAEIQITSAYRSKEEQWRLYNEFLAGTRAGPVARAGWSQHQLGDAIDVAAGTSRDLLVRVGPQYGIYQRKDDKPHFDFGGKPAANPDQYTNIGAAGGVTYPVANAVIEGVGLLSPVSTILKYLDREVVQPFKTSIERTALVILGAGLLVVAFTRTETGQKTIKTVVRAGKAVATRGASEL